MNRAHKSPMEKVNQIDGLLSKIKMRLDQLGTAPHVARRGQNTGIRTVLSDSENCAASCPTCALQRKYARRRARLGPLQLAALKENAQTRAASVRVSNLTVQHYSAMKLKARTRKELAGLLQMTGPGLIRWEKRNGLFGKI